MVEENQLTEGEQKFVDVATEGVLDIGSIFRSAGQQDFARICHTYYTHLIHCKNMSPLEASSLVMNYILRRHEDWERQDREAEEEERNEREDS